MSCICFLNSYFFSFGRAGSSLLHGLFSSCAEWGLSLAAVLRLLAAGASLVEHGPWCTWSSEAGAHGLCSAGSGAVADGLSCF